MTVNTNEVWFDNTDTTVERVLIHNNNGTLMLMKEKEKYGLVWRDDAYLYFITCNTDTLAREKLLEIAESVK